MSFLKMCVPADGVKGIKQFVLESIVGAGGKPCPPGIVGVGIGGSADYAMYLAKEAIMRPIGTRNSDPLVAQLEDELYGLLNETGIGPMGLGGALFRFELTDSVFPIFIESSLHRASGIPNWVKRRALAYAWRTHAGAPQDAWLAPSLPR
jgi:tartrate/fumarate subfamily iron-sulfur-dependent hydro-lyase alpha chain